MEQWLLSCVHTWLQPVVASGSPAEASLLLPLLLEFLHDHDNSIQSSLISSIESCWQKQTVVDAQTLVVAGDHTMQTCAALIASVDGVQLKDTFSIVNHVLKLELGLTHLKTFLVAMTHRMIALAPSPAYFSPTAQSPLKAQRPRSNTAANARPSPGSRASSQSHSHAVEVANAVIPTLSLSSDGAQPVLIRSASAPSGGIHGDTAGALSLVAHGSSGELGVDTPVEHRSCVADSITLTNAVVQDEGDEADDDWDDWDEADGADESDLKSMAAECNGFLVKLVDDPKLKVCVQSTISSVGVDMQGILVVFKIFD